MKLFNIFTVIREYKNKHVQNIRKLEQKAK